MVECDECQTDITSWVYMFDDPTLDNMVRIVCSSCASTLGVKQIADRMHVLDFEAEERRSTLEEQAARPYQTKLLEKR